MAKRSDSTAKIFQFPLPLEPAEDVERDLGAPVLQPKSNVLSPRRLARSVDVVISGTYRKDTEGLRRTFEELKDLGCQVLSPSNVTVVSERDGFVFMDGEQAQAPETIEIRHLTAIQESQFVWLHAPNGYVGTSASLEVGFAHAIGIPVFSKERPTDPVLASFVRSAETCQEVVNIAEKNALEVPAPAIRSFQKYYSRAAIQRGYAGESARDTMLLMVEEVGELARAIRKKQKLTRHGRSIRNDEGLELADVFIYVVHLANILGVNLSTVVREKELLNIEKIVRAKPK